MTLRRPMLFLTAAAAVLLLTFNASAQKYPKPTISPNPGGALEPVADRDPVAPAAVDPVEAPRTQSRVERPMVEVQPLTSGQVQAWQQIGRLHQQFVQSQLTGVDAEIPADRTNERRQELVRLWERLAEIEQQLIATGAYAETPQSMATRQMTRRREADGPVPGVDLDLQADPLNATNQGVPAEAVEKDRQTARSILQEDRSPAPDPATRNNPPEEIATSDDVVRRPAGTRETVVEDDAVVTGRPTSTAADALAPSRLWQEFVEVHQQILLTEVALIRSSAAAPRNDDTRPAEQPKPTR